MDAVRKVIVLGAAGRDFHNFNVFFRYQTTSDIVAADLTIEEMEEYQPHVDNDAVVFAGVDYAAVMEQAAREADVILWDGGNNDMA